MREKAHIKNLRNLKKVCDWDNWKDEYFEMACRGFDDCADCGAYERYEKKSVAVKKK